MHGKHEVVGSNPTQANFLYGTEKPLLNMNTIYIGKFSYTPMITSQNSIRNVSVATDEGPSPKLALSKGGSRRNTQS